MADADPPQATPGSADDYRGDQFLAFLIVMTVITTASIILRFVSRGLGKTGNRFWWDDWTALFAVPFIYAQLGLSFAMLNYGLGYHMWVVMDKLPTFMKLLFSVYFVYDVALFVTKESALLFFSRIFPKRNNSAWWNWALWITHGINAAWLIGIIFGTIFMCDPVEKGWNPMIPGTCGENSALWLGSAVPSVVIDLLILLLPLPKIWGLQLSTARKTGVTLVFVLGYCVIIVSLGRLITLLTNIDGLNTDVTYEIVPVSMWVSAEAPVTLLCICLPAMLPLGKHIVKTYFSRWISQVTSFVSTKGPNTRGGTLRSKTGNFTSTTAPGSYDMHMRTGKSSRSTFGGPGDRDSVNSDRSNRGILPMREHTACALGEPGVFREDMPSRAIRVDNEIVVDRRYP
ncbi:hypothetical protein SODALDRAFT_330954 [Sodiomyces alkalinus F11]|uniref:Rhodopsin domain-containing protein n=1 Tax=Sodiomyces alkalinus (strain CBS 110278 / VKM F-3762 / F11) TaxID=1314773 RepID=A0A3N2Q385_SODAK|nr:hypothetical protein SODALDRAFT_330954 [Sodiomyces alkalinus F11]ROT41233.1 hypothetical protein SODALDRAFT_330954 [Sodiomyces alkalinus F11]